MPKGQAGELLDRRHLRPQLEYPHPQEPVVAGHVEVQLLRSGFVGRPLRRAALPPPGDGRGEGCADDCLGGGRAAGRLALCHDCKAARSRRPGRQVGHVAGHVEREPGLVVVLSYLSSSIAGKICHQDALQSTRLQGVEQYPSYYTTRRRAAR